VEIKKMNKKIKKTGFTLVELLVVIAIISILTIISVSSFRNAQIKARDAQRKSDLEQVSKALMLYYSDTGTFPASFNFGNENPGFVVSGTIYMRKTPQDPKSPSSVYVYRTDGKSFNLFANLESTKDSQLNSGYWPSGVGIGVSYRYGVASPNTVLKTW
jgi:prepilin-type N-terminal cleavage/methylation domain-containing protein